MAKAPMSALDDAIGTVWKGTKEAIKGNGGTILHSNKAISSGTGKVTSHLANNYFGAAETGYRMMKGGQTFKDALGSTFYKNADKLYDKTGKRIVDEAGKAVGKGELNYGKIAGSYLGASAVARVASGGGVYKDGNGNSNLIGVPFV